MSTCQGQTERSVASAPIDLALESETKDGSDAENLGNLRSRLRG
jgi:hypothetical protein